MQLASSDRAIPRVAAFVAGSWIVYLTLQPFAWDLSQAGPRLGEGLGTWDTDGWLPQVLVGVLFGWCVGGLSRNHWRRYLVATVLFFAVLEVAQAAVQYRHPRSVDLVMHLVGGAVGFALGVRMFGFATGHRSVRIARVLVVAGVLLPAWWTFDTASRTSLSTWDPTFDLVVGNESTGDRPWQGCIRGFALYDRALDPSEIEQLVAEPLAEDWDPGKREGLGAVTLFVFRSEDALEDRVGRVSLVPMGPTLSLSGEGVCLPATSDSGAGPVGLVSRSGEGGLTSGMARRSAFTIELVCSSATQGQSGPVRILSLSANPAQRNFTVGQEGADLRLRVRSVANGPNGDVNVPIWDGVFQSGDMQHLFVTYDRGQTLLYRKGVAQAPDHDADPLLHLVLHRVWQVLLVFLPVAAFAGIGWPGVGALRRGVLAGLVGAGCLWIAELIALSVVGTAFDFSTGFLALVSVPTGSILIGMAVDRFGMIRG